MEIIALQQQPGKHDEIAALLHSEWSHLANWASPQTISQRLQQRSRQPDGSFTLYSSDPDGMLMGTASVIEYELNDIPARHYWLGEVFTAAPFRGLGIGTALVNACIAAAQERGIAELWLYTPDQQALYQRLGWQEVEQREVSGERVSVMVLTIAG